MSITAYETTLAHLANERPDLLVMTAENRAHIRTLPARLGPRFIDVGIAEQTLVGAAAGLAMRGWTPVVHALAAFLVMRAFEFIRTDVGIGRLPVKLVGYIPGVLSDANGPTHQALEDIGLMRGIPGMQVVCPADEQELVQAMEAILERPGPCYLRYTAEEAAVEHRTRFEVGKAEILSEGEAVSLLTYGPLLAETAHAARLLEARGAPVRLVNMRTLAPVDEGAIVDAARRTHMIVTVEDHFRVGGLYSIVCEVLCRYGLTRRVVPIAFEERWFQPALLPDVLQAEGLSGPQIAARVLRATLET